MYSKIVLHTIFIIFFFLTVLNIFAQNPISGAESIAYHAGTESYYVSSLNNNRIIKIDKDGNRSIYIQGITAFGNCIKSDILYVSSGTYVRGYNLLTKEQVLYVKVAGSRQLDGMTFAENGFLYVVESRNNKIFKVDVENGNSTLFIDEGLEGATQDLIFDHINKRIIACAYERNSLAIDKSSKFTTNGA